MGAQGSGGGFYNWLSGSEGTFGKDVKKARDQVLLFMTEGKPACLEEQEPEVGQESGMREQAGFIHTGQW